MVKKRLIILILLFLGIFTPCSIQAVTTQSPYAVQGVLDLTAWDFAEQGVLHLDGEWDFYWHEYLQPTQLAKSKTPPTKISVPSTWRNKNYLAGKLPSEGYATYHLTVTLDPNNNEIKALKIPSIYTAYEMYVNGQLVSSNGILGISKSEVRPSGASKIIFLAPQDGTLDIVVQVANFHHLKGGIRKSLTLGAPAQILRIHDFSTNMQLVLIGALILMGMNYLVHFCFRREDRFSIYFALFCFTLSLYLLFSQEAPIYIAFPNLNWAFAKRIEYLSLYSCLPIYIFVIKELYPTKFLRGAQDIIHIFSLMVVSITVFAPPTIYISAMTFDHALISFYLICYLCLIVKSALEKQAGAFLPLIAGIIVLASVIIDFAVYYSLISSYLYFFPIGVLSYLFAQSIILSKRSSVAINEAEELSAENAHMVDEITTLNHNLEDRISQRTAQLNEIIEVLNYEIMERTETEQKLKVYATTDIMTGLSNRFSCLDTLTQQLDMSKLNEWHLSVCFVDIDNLKTINDDFGHSVGDDLIINFGNLLKGQVRQSDTIGRIGGDEFLIIFPWCTQKEAEKLWIRIEEKIEEFNQEGNKPYKISISHGFAEYEPGREISAQQLIELADNEMYQCKKPEQ